MTDAMPIVVGFVLTTVVGGWWAAQLQQRTWKHQNDVRLREEEREHAATVCHELSRLLDKRLYRMRRLYGAIEGYHQGSGGEEVLDARLRDYDEVLYEWNDSLNVNLAVVGSHFGPAARDYLYQLYEDFRRVGAELETTARQVRQGAEPAPPLATISPEFEGWQPGSLNERVYLLVLAMMTQLRDGLFGRCVGPKVETPTLEAGQAHSALVSR